MNKDNVIKTIEADIERISYELEASDQTARNYLLGYYLALKYVHRLLIGGSNG